MATPSDATGYSVERDFAHEPQRRPANRSSQTFAQEAFAQTKATELYVKTCSVLQPRKYLVDTFQETVLWRQPLLSVLLYLCVHSAFWYLYFSQASMLTLVADMVFWVLLADAFVVVASRHRNSENRAPRAQSESLRRPGQEAKLMSYEEAYITAHSKPNLGEMVPLEVVCLWVAEVLLWCYTFKLAVKHWNREQPVMLGFFIMGAGAICVCVGYFVSVITIAYLLIMFLLLYPVVIFYNLVPMLSRFVDSNYPILAAKFQHRKTQLEHLFESFKKLLKPPPDSDFRDLQLLPNGSREGAQSAAAGAQGSNGQNALMPPYQSITLPPFGSLVPQVDPYDSLASLMPQAEGFQSISSFLGASPSPPSRLPPTAANLESIAEIEGAEGVSSESPAGDLETGAQVPSTSEVQPDTTTLEPFPSDGRNFLSESPDIDENGPVALAAIENFDDVSSTAGPGFGAMPSASDPPYQDPPDYIYQAGDRPPPYSADDSASPLFSGRFVNPPVPGAKVTQPISSSTPLGRNENSQTTLRQRDVHRNSDT